MKRIILVVILIVIIASGFYAYKEYNRKNKDLSSSKAIATTEALLLITTFEQDSASATKQYVDKIIAVTGTIKKMESESRPVIIFLGDAAQMSSVQCSMDSTYSTEYTALQTGASVTIKGIVTGVRKDDLFGTDVILNRCVLFKK